MIGTLGAGFFNATFFHLLSHAFFKALLFITVGNIIHISIDFQDFRKASLSSINCPLTISIRFAANLSLCGLPFTRGFFSKDLCIELFSEAASNSILIIIFLLATALTAAYTSRFIYILMLNYSKLLNLSLLTDKSPEINYSILLLLPLAIRRGSAIRWLLNITPTFTFLRFSRKNFTLLIILFTGIIFLVGAINKLLTVSQKFYFFPYIWGLPLITTRLWRSVILKEGIRIRSLIDLQWTPSILTSRLYKLDNRSNLLSMQERSRIFVLSGGLLWIIMLVLLYLCVIDLAISFKIKI